MLKFSDYSKGSVKDFREDMRLQHINRMGVHKCIKKDRLTCWKSGCSLCYECRTFKCYACRNDIWLCNCTFGNIRIEPSLMELHFEDYLSYIRESVENETKN